MRTFSGWSWLRSLIKGRQWQNNPIYKRRQGDAFHLVLEQLEERVTPASVDFVYHAQGAQALTLRLENDQLEIVDSHVPTVLASSTLSDTNHVLIDGNGFDVTLTIDASLPHLAGGVLFAGGAGNSTLIGPALNLDWHVTGAGAGDMGGPAFVNFTGVENLSGASNNVDTFYFGPYGTLSGTVAGGDGGFDSVVLDGGQFGRVAFTAWSKDAGTIARDADLITYVGMEPITDNTVTTNRVFEDAPSIATQVHLFRRTSDGMLTIESDDDIHSFESVSFADPTVSLTIKLGFNAKGTDEHITVDALGTLNADLVLDTGSTNKNTDGEDTVTFQGNINLTNHNLSVLAEHININSGVILSTSNGTNAGNITLTGWNITANSNAQIVAVGSNKASSGKIDIEAIDRNAYFTPLVNVDQSDVSVTIKDGVQIKGADVTIQAIADNQHILNVDDFADSNSYAKVALALTDVVGQAIEGLTQIVAGISYSKANANIDIQAGSTIDAQNLIVRSTANAAAVTAPIGIVVGVGLGISVTDANVTVAGSVTTTGDAVFQSSSDHIENVVADVSGLAGAAAALAISVAQSNVTTNVVDTANLTIGGSLIVAADTTDHNRTMARSAAGTDGSVGISIAISVEVNNSNAYLDGTAAVTGDVVVGATQQNLPISAAKLFIIPGFADGVSAQAGAGENTTGDLLDDAKSSAITSAIAPVKAFALKQYYKRKGTTPAADDGAPPLPVEVGAAFALSIDHSKVDARIGDGDADADNKNGKVSANGSISVTSKIQKRPAVTASSATTYDASAQPSGGGANNKFNGSFAIGIGLYYDDAYATINSKAEVDTKGTLLVKAESLNDYQVTYGVNLVTPFTDSPAFATTDGTKFVHNGDVVEIKGGHTGGGDVGTLYKYVGVDRNIDLGKENFTNTGSWVNQGSRISKAATGFIGNLTTYLNNNLGLDNNAIDTWGQAVAGGDTDVAVAGVITITTVSHTAEAIIKSGAKINQDSTYRTSAQNVVVTSRSVNDSVNFGGNIKLPGIQGTTKDFKLAATGPGGGSTTSDGKGAVGFTFQMYDVENTVTAKIEDGVLLHATSLAVTAATSSMTIDVGASGGKSNGVAFNGVFIVNLIIDKTTAQIDNGATIDVGSGVVADSNAHGASVYVSATDTTYAIEIGGGVAISDHVGIGATVGINIVNRQTEAFIGNQADDASNDTRGSFTSGGSVRLNAVDDGFVGAFVVSGAKTSDNSEDAPQGDTGLKKSGGGSVDDPGKLPNNQSSYDDVIAQLKQKFGETPSQASDPESAGNKKGKSGISISGAVAIDDIHDDARAYIHNSGAVTLDALSLTLSALNSTAVGSLAGAVALSLGGSGPPTLQVGIAGAVGVNYVAGTTDAFIDGATSVSAQGLFVTATRTGQIGSLTAGVAGAVGRKGFAIGGSVSVTQTSYTTAAELKNTTGTISGDVTLHANDDTDIILIAGSGGFGGKAGVGASVSFTEIDNTVRATIDNVHGNSGQSIADFKHTGKLDLQATTDADIISVTASAGVGTGGGTASGGGGSGTLSINFINNTVQAQILNSKTTSDSTGDISLLASDNSFLLSIAGAVGAGKSAALGAALGFNFVRNDIKAAVENSTLKTDGKVSITAQDDETAAGVAIGVAAGTGTGFALEGSVSVNQIINTIDAHISGNSNVDADGAVTVKATDESLIVAISGGVAATVSGSFGVGASISYNRISNGIAAYIDSSTVQSDSSSITLSATSSPMMVAIGAAGGGGKSAGGAGTLTINSIANTVDAHITASPTISAFGDVHLTASEAASMFVFALAGAGGASGGAIGASIAYNFIGGDDTADPNVISFNDGTVDGTKSVQVAGDDSTTTSNVVAYIDNSDVLAGGRVLVLSGFADPASIMDPAFPVAFDPTTVTVTADTIHFTSPHGLHTGDEVVYHGGASPIGGLVEGQSYYVIVVDGSTIKLARTASDAAAGRAISLATSGGAAQTLTGVDSNNGLTFAATPVTVSVTPDNSGILTLLVNASAFQVSGGNAKTGLFGNAPTTTTNSIVGSAAPKLTIDGTNDTLNLTVNGVAFNIVLEHKDYTPDTLALEIESKLRAALPGNAQEIRFAADETLTDGQQIVYHSGGASAIGGLTDGATYYVIKLTNHSIQLAASSADATAKIAISLDPAQGGAQAHSITPLLSSASHTFGTSDVKVSSAAADEIVFTTPHGLSTGDAVTYRANGGTSIGGLVDGATYFVIFVDSTHIRLAGSLSDAQNQRALFFTAAGTGTTQKLVAKLSSPLAADTKAVDPASDVTLTADAIHFSADHGLKTGDEVVYHKGATANTAIGGLTNDGVYYVIRVDSQTIKLASTQANALAGIAISLSSIGNGAAQSISPLDFGARLVVNPSSQSVVSNEIRFADNHNLVAGQEVVYHTGASTNSAIGGLVDGHTYYVIKVSDTSIKLAATALDAQNLTFITLTSLGTGASHSLTPLGTAVSFAPASGVTVSNANADEITFASAHQLASGDAVIYKNGGGTSIGGLVDGDTYYVIKIDNTHIKLAATSADALATTPHVIFLTSFGTGTNHSLILKPSGIDIGGVAMLLPVSLGAQIVSVTAAGSGGETISGAGAISLNFVRMNVDAHISNAKSTKKVQAAGDVIVAANDTSHVDAGAGSVAIELNAGVAINASVSVNDIRNTVKAYVEGAKVASTAGDVSVNAAELAREVNIALGGAGSNEGLAFGGSFAINFIKNTVDAHIKSNVASGASDVDADGSISVVAADSAAIATLAGNIAASIGGTAAVGLAFAVNDVSDNASALIDGSTANAATGDLTVSATFAKPDDLPPGLDVQIAAMAVSGGGADQIAGAGSVSLNWIRNTVEAKIANVTNLGAGDEISAGGNIDVTASDTSTINSLAGAVAIAGIGAAGAPSGAIGASVAYNYLGGDPNDPTSTTKNVVRAAIENVTGGIHADRIDVHATYEGQINNITVAGAAAGTFALGGAVSINKIHNTSDAHVSGSTNITTDDNGSTSFMVKAEDTSTIQALAGGIGLAIAAEGGTALAAGVSVASNEIQDTTSAYIDASKVTSAGGIALTATSTPTIKALTIGVAVGGSSGGGGLAGSGAGAGSGNTIGNTVQAYISNSLASASKGVFANGGPLTLTATDSPTILAGAGGFGFAGSFGGGGGVGVSIGISVAINDIADTVQSYISGSTVSATGHDINLSATETATIKALTIGGAVGASGGGGGGVGVGAAGAGSGNTVTNHIYAYIDTNSVVSTTTSGDIILNAWDQSSVTANAGGVGIGIALGGSGGGAVSLGVGAATNDIENIVKAYIDGAKATSAGGVHISATETATINALTIGGAVSVAAGGQGGLSLAAAGADSESTIKNTVSAYVQNSTTSSGKGVSASGGSVWIHANDTSTITANGGGIGISVGIGGYGGAAVAVGFSKAVNDIENTVQAWVDTANVSAVAHDVDISAIEGATIVALSIGGAVAVGAGGLGAAAGAGAGGNSSNKTKNKVEAYVRSGSLITTTSGNVNLTATDTAHTTAETVAASVAVAAGLFGAPAIAIGAALADNHIENTVRAYSDSSGITSAGGISIAAGSTATSNAESIAASVSASISIGSLALTGGGANSTNTVHNTIAAFIQGADAAHKSTITAAGDIHVTATESAIIDTKVGAGALAIGIAGGSIAVSESHNTIDSTIKAYVDNATLTSTAGGIFVTAGAGDTATALSVATSLAISIGASGAGGDATSNVSPIVEAYTGGGVTLNAKQDISITATTTNSSQATTYGASGGLVAIGTGTTDVTASGSVKAHIDGVVTGANNLTVQATATDSSNSSATGLAGGAVAATGSSATATTSPTVEAYTGNNNITARNAFNVGATVTPTAIANSLGVAAAAGVAIGVSIANAVVNPNVKAHIGGASSTITAGSLSVVASQVVPASGDSAQASAIGASGGVLIGTSATVSFATHGDDTTKSLTYGYIDNGTTLVVTGSTAVSALSNSKQNASSDNFNLGTVAAGAGAAIATSNTDTQAYLGTNVKVTGGSLSVTATGNDDNLAKVIAGSGGVYAAAGAQATTTTTSATIAQVKDGDGVEKIDLTGTGTGTLQIAANHTATFNAQDLTVAGGALAGTGARADNTVVSDTEALVGNHAILWAKDVDIEATNHVSKPAVDPALPNILGATGGLVSGAGAVSLTNISFTTLVTIGSYTEVQVKGSQSAPGNFYLKALNDIQANDKVTLGTGGALAGAGAFSTIQTLVDQAKVEVKDHATLKSVGAIVISARGQGDIRDTVNADTFGAATVAIAKSVVDIEPTNTVLVDASVTIHAEGDLDVSAGTDTNFNRDQYTIKAVTDTLAGSVIPISAVDALAKLIQTNTITVSGGSVLESARDAKLHAESQGLADMTGHAHATSWTSAVADAINGQSFDEGTVTQMAHGTVDISGTVRTGIERRKELDLTSWNRDNGTVTAGGLSTGDITFTVTQAPLASTLVQELANAQHELNIFTGSGNQTLIDFYTAEVTRLQALLQAQGLLDQPTSGNGTPPPQPTTQYVMTVNVDDIWAQAGTIDIRADVLQGNRGTFDAPGDASVIINNATPAFLNIHRITIPDTNGGVYFNGVPVNNALVTSLNAPDTGVVVGTVSFNTFALPGTGTPPVISITNTFDPLSAPAGDSYPAPDIAILGNVDEAGVPRGIENLGGNVNLLISGGKGNIQIKAPVRARNLSVVTGGDVFIDGVTQFAVGGEALSQWRSVTDLTQGIDSNGNPITGKGADGTYGTGDEANSTAQGKITNILDPTLAASRLIQIGTVNQGVDPTNNVIDGVATGIHYAQSIALPYATGGTFTLTFNGQTATGIAYNVTAAALASALNALNQGTFTVTGKGTQGDPFIATLTSSYTNYPQMASNSTGLTGAVSLYADRIFITANYINIDGIMQSGKANYTLTIGSEAATEIDAIKRSGVSGLVILRSVSNADFVVRYDTAYNRIQVEEVQVSGGYIELHGHILNTGNGEIRLLGAYGNISITNNTTYDLVVERLDASQRGAGTLLLNDTSLGANYVTLYEKAGGQVTKTVDPGTGASPTFSTVTDSTSYAPKSGYRYGWSVAQATYVRKFKTTASSTWAGIDALSVDPATIDWDTVEVVGQPVLAGEGPYYYVDNSLTSKAYTFSYASETTSDNVYVTDQHTESTWYGKKTYYTTIEDESKVEQVYTNTIKADRSIAINFLGASEGTITVTSAAGILVDGAIQNSSGVTTLTAQGQINRLSDDASVGGRKVVLNAGTGIGALAPLDIQVGGVAPFDFTTTKTLTAVITNDTVKLGAGYAGGGIAGDVYKYLGQPANIDLTTSNYADSTKWQHLSATTAKFSAAAPLTRVIAGDRVLVNAAYSHGGVANSVYVYSGNPATLDLSVQDYSVTTSWTKTNYFSSLIATTTTGDIALTQLSGDLNVDHVTPGLSGAATLTAQGSIVVAQLSSSTFASGNVGNTTLAGSATLTASTGGIGASGHAIIVYSGAKLSDKVTATAQGSIYLTEGAGDLRVNKIKSLSSSGIVAINVPNGNLLDANSTQVVDERTEKQLASGPWQDLGLTNEASVTPGDTVKIAASFQQMGVTTGSIYRYIGSAPANLDLGAQNYTNASLWTLVTGTTSTYTTDLDGFSARDKIAGTIASYADLKTSEYKTYWNYRAQQTQSQAIGLTSGQTYYVVIDPTNPNKVLLAASHADAVAGTAIVLDLTSIAAGINQRLYTSANAYVSFNPVTGVASLADTILLAAGHGLHTGDAVTYVVPFDSQYHVKLTAPEIAYDKAQLGLDDAGITTLENKRTAIYQDLDTRYGQFGNTYNSTFAYTPTTTEVNALTSRIKVWTIDALLTTLSAGLLKPSANTQVNFEDPNIVGHDITITTSKGVGNASGQVTIDMQTTPVVLTTAQRIALAAADRADVSYLAASPVSAFVSFHDNGAQPDTITRATGSWLSDGLTTGMFIQVAGNTSNATAKGTYYEIANVTSTVITLTATAALTNDAGKSVTITPIVLDPRTPQAMLSAQFGAHTIARTDSGSWLEDGFKVGMSIQVADQTLITIGTAPAGSSNVTSTNQFYTITAITSSTITVSQTLAVETDKPVIISGPKPVLHAIVIDQTEDVNVNASGSITITAATNVFLGSGKEASGSESALNINQISAADMVRIKGRQGVFNVAAANTPNVVTTNADGDLIVEAGQNAIGTSSAPFLINLAPAATLTARAFGSLYISEHNAGNTAGNMNVETVSSDTGGVYLRADGSILDALNTDTPKIGAAHIDLTAGGSIGASGNFLETDLTPLGTLTATAVGDIRLHETAGDMGVDHIMSTTGDIYLRAEGSIHDAASSAYDNSGVASKPATDIYGNNITLTSDAGEIGSLVDDNALDIDSAYGGAQNGVLTTSSYLDTNIIETTGDLNIFEISTGVANPTTTVYTAYVAAALGSILNGKTTGPNVLSGRAWLFAKQNIGAANKSLSTQVGVLQGESTLGASWLSNNGALLVTAILGSNTNGMHAGGGVYVSAASPITIDKDIIADSGPIIKVAFDDNNDGTDIANDDVPDNLIVKAGVTVWSKQSYVKLLAGDDLTIEAGAVVKAATTIVLQGDFQGAKDGSDPAAGHLNADPGVGSIITIKGTVDAPEITIKGESDPDTIDIDMSTAGNSIIGHATILGGGGADNIHIANLNSRTDSMDVDGQDGADTYVVQIRGGSTQNLINVFDTGTDASANRAFNGAAVDGVADTIIVPANLYRTGQALLYGGPGTSDGVITANHIYFVVVDAADPTKIHLAATYADAMASVPVILDLSGITGSGHSLTSMDSLTVYGTTGADNFLLRASAKEFVDGGVAFVAALHGAPASAVERVNYNRQLENLVLDAGAGDDNVALDDNWVPTAIYGGAGADHFQIGQIFKSQRDAAHAAIAPDDAFATTLTSRGYLSNGISVEASINGGADGDTFTVYRNVAAIHLLGDAGDDTFIVRAFALEGSTDENVSGNSGSDLVEYVLNAPVNIVGGDGTDTVRIIGTEFADQIVVTKDHVYGGGVSVTYTEIEKLEIDAAEGDDTFYVVSTDPNVQTTLYGGYGSDTFNVGGDVPELRSGSSILFPATAGKHTLADIATNLLTLDGAASPGYTVSLDSPVMLPGETNLLPPVGAVTAYSGTGTAGAVDSLTIDGTNLGILTDNPLVNQILNPLADLVGKVLEIAAGPGLGRFWLITGVAAGSASNSYVLTLKNAVAPAPTWGLPNNTSKYAITHLSPNFFVDEALSVDHAFIYNDSAPGQSGVLTDLDHATDSYGNLIVTSTMLTGLGMSTGIRSTNLENLDILLGHGDDTFTVRGTSQGTATKIDANDGADLVNVGSSAADNNGNLDLIQGRLTVLGDANPDAAHTDHIYINDHAKVGRANYLITPTQVVNYVLPASFVPSPPVANFNPPRPTFAGMDYDGTTEYLRIDGTDDVNIFNVQPSLKTEFFIDGRSPASGVPLPNGGDYLMLDTQTTGTTGRKLHITALGQGYWGFSSAHKPVSFIGIERFNHVATYAVANAGLTPTVKVYDAETNELEFQVTAYETSYRGGVRAITGDVNFDGIPDLIVAPGKGRNPTIHIYNGSPNASAAYPHALLASFDAFPQPYKNGLNIAIGDVNNDGANDLIVAADSGGLPNVEVYNGKTVTTTHTLLVAPFLAYASGFRGGVRVAAGDLNGDGYAEIVTGSGPGMVATVSVFTFAKLGPRIPQPSRTYTPFGNIVNKGLFVAVGDVNGDGVRDVIASADAGWLPMVQAVSGAGLMNNAPLGVLEYFAAFANSTRTGVRVAAKPTDGGNPGFVEKVDLLLATGPGGGALSHKGVLAKFKDTKLNPDLVDKIFAEATYDGFFLG